MIRFWPNGGTGIHKRLKISRPLGLRVRIPLRLPHYSPVAQLAEHLAVNQRVPGSSPGGGAITWRGGRVVEGTGLENQRRETYRGFESHPLRHVPVAQQDRAFAS